MSLYVWMRIEEKPQGISLEELFSVFEIIREKGALQTHVPKDLSLVQI